MLSPLLIPRYRSTSNVEGHGGLVLGPLLILFYSATLEKSLRLVL